MAKVYHYKCQKLNDTGSRGRFVLSFDHRSLSVSRNVTTVILKNKISLQVGIIFQQGSWSLFYSKSVFQPSWSVSNV